MNDTCFGINNEGGLSFDYYHEDTDQVDGANVYNGQLSTLWVNFRQAFPDKIKETYQDLRSNSVLNYDEIVDQFINKGSNKWSESVYNEDGDFKYISMLRSNNDATNLPQVRGTGEEHLRYFLENRFNYCDSKWYAGEYISKYDPVTGDIVNNFVTLRIYTPVDESGNPRTDLVIPASADITITPYSHMYGGVRYKANGTLIQERLEANETYTFDAPNEVFNDTETAIYGAPQLSSLGDLAPLYLGYIDVGAATKLVELKIGDGTPGYQNNNLYHLAVGTNRLLKKIDIQNCAGFNQALVLTGCPNIEEVYAKGSSITGVELPDSGYLKVLQLPATITNLTLKNQLYIEDLTIEGYENLKTITIENCPVVNSLDILDKAINVERVRLTNVDWHYDDASILYELIDRDIAGIDENGVNTDTMWIDGKCHIETLTGNELLEIKTLYPYLDITYTTLTSQLIYMSEDGTEELHREIIYNGGDGTNPVANGTIETPTKESTAQYDFTFGGWSLSPNSEPNENALKNVEADRTVYTAFNKAIRSYTVKFYNGTTLLHSTVVEYGSDATYVGSTPTNNSTGNTADFEFIGWKPAPTNIQGDTNCYAQYYDKREITDGWATIAQNCSDGNATSKYAIGAYKNLHIGAIELPYDFYGGHAVILNDELHILSGAAKNTAHYKYDGITWIKVSTLPYNMNWGQVIVYNNEIHILGDEYWGDANKHYKWNGTQWTSVSTLPEYLNKGCAVVYNNEIHILMKTTHYKYDGASWISVSTLPYDFTYGDAIVYNDEIHILGGFDNKNHYKWNGKEWTSVSTLPHQDRIRNPVIVYNNELYIMGFGNNKCYKLDGSSWVVAHTLPYKLNEGCAIVYNNQIHLLGGNNSTDDYRYHYYLDGSEWKLNGVTETIPMEVIGHNHDELPDGVRKWEKLTSIPEAVCQSGTSKYVVYNNEVHALGNTYHHKWNEADGWVEVSTIPYSFQGSAVVYNNEIHLLGNSNTTGKTHYKWNEPDGWIELPESDIAIGNSQTLVEYNGKLHVMSGLDHYTWDGTTWTKICNTGAYACQRSTHVIDDKIHQLFQNGVYKTYDEVSGWVEVCKTTQGNNLQIVFAYNNELYLTDNMNIIYKFNGTNFETINAKMPTLRRKDIGEFGNILVYKNEVHAFGANSYNYRNLHYKWSLPKFEQIGKLPIRLQGGGYVIYNNELHLLGGGLYETKDHYKWNGTEWTKVDTLPVGSKIGCVAVFNGEIYMSPAMNKSIYKWDGTTWAEHSILPFTPNGSILVVYNNELHILGGQQYGTLQNHYKWNEIDGWVSVSKLPFALRSKSDTNMTGDALVYNNELHIINETNHYKWNGIEWISASIPSFNNGQRAVVYNNDLYVFDYGLYKYVNGIWEKVGNAPSATWVGYGLIEFRGKLYLLGGNKSHGYDIHYVYENPRATLTFFAKNALKDARKMHGFYMNNISWSDTALRSFLNGSFIKTLPSALQTSIKEVNKLYNSNTESALISRDKCFILSQSEVNLSSAYNDAYDVFTDNTSRVRKTTNETPIIWWLRTKVVNHYYYLGVGVSGNQYNFGTINGDGYVVPGFCI